ncbi:MAG TPA: PilZ domain-containing protein [Candidatus Omnitrophota bacterium]|nr:PilZ domain-containing protein [Candidatus Omnitrophota bacterium]
MIPYEGPERRQHDRIDHVTPLAYKVCKKETVTQLLQGYTSDISKNGILCRLNAEVNEDDILWLSFDRSTLIVCEELEKNSLIYQNGIIGKVVRIQPSSDGAYDVGVHFITRSEKDFSDFSHIYKRVDFTLGKDKKEFGNDES